MRWKKRKMYHCHSYKKMIAIIMSVIGCIIIIQVVPLKVWLLILGVLLVISGWIIFRMT
ncbi:hypothetical protein [Clostridiisalibacter paucivorans]|uniref:hypothetical protein n=1 Tax=Clostridiisalibacter paucivorans TaxID=408753 RepID=UPI0012EB5488|nr:hypothetical protein [Clostridiisalibacter paucivorans]